MRCWAIVRIGMLAGAMLLLSGQGWTQAEAPYGIAPVPLSATITPLNELAEHPGAREVIERHAPKLLDDPDMRQRSRYPLRDLQANFPGILPLR